MGLTTYKFWNEHWVESKELTQRDIALFINEEEEKIYIWTGNNVYPQKISEAKEELGQIKLQFPTYQFREFKNNIDASMQKSLKERLLDTDNIQKKNQKNKTSLAQLRNILMIPTISIILVSTGLILSLLNKNIIESEEIYMVLFQSHQTFSQFIQFNAVLMIFATLLLTVITTISFHLSEFRRAYITTFILGAMLIFIFTYWNSTTQQMISIIDTTPFFYSRSEFLNFIRISSIVQSISLILLLLSNYLPLGYPIYGKGINTNTPEIKETKTKKEEIKKVEKKEDKKVKVEKKGNKK